MEFDLTSLVGEIKLIRLIGKYAKIDQNMDKGFDYIKAVNNNKQGKIALNKLSNEKGIVIGEFNENNDGWTVQFSLDYTSLIKLTTTSDISLLGYCDKNTFLERLTRDINSDDLSTRQLASEALCYYIESNGSKLDFDFLRNSVNIMVERLSMEGEDDVEQKLSEGIFEFIWLGKLTNDEERSMIIQLAEMNKESLFCYLDDEDYLQYEEVQKIISQERK